MSKERELLKRWLAGEANQIPTHVPLLIETQNLLAQPEQEQEPLSEDAVDECLANAIKNGWYPFNEDSYRQGFWDAVKLLEVENEPI